MPKQGDFKLHPDQYPGVARRYREGESSPVIAASLGISAALVLRVVRQAGVLRTKSESQTLLHASDPQPTEEEKAEILQRYRDGEGAQRIAEILGWGRGKFGHVQRVLREAGEETRNKQEAALARWGKDVRTISPERWRELYWAPGSGYPSMSLLGRHFGVSQQCVRECLLAAGIALRTRSEQLRIDLKLGRQTTTKGRPNPGAAKNFGAMTGAKALRGMPRSKAWRAKLSAAAKARALRVICPCAWCGNPVERIPSKAAPPVFCSRSCLGQNTQWHRRFGAAPRPPIVTRIAAAFRLTPGSGRTPLAVTYLDAERAGERWGAREEEIEAALEELGVL